MAGSGMALLRGELFRLFRDDYALTGTTHSLFVSSNGDIVGGKEGGPCLECVLVDKVTHVCFVIRSPTGY